MITEIHNESAFIERVLSKNGPVLVEFVNEWNGACHIMAPVIERLIDEFGVDVYFCRVDVDSNKEVAEMYGIRDVPTLFFFKDGILRDHFIGAGSEKVLSNKLRWLLGRPMIT